MAKKTTGDLGEGAKPQAAGPVQVEATDAEKRMAVVLCRGHLGKQPAEGQLAYFGSMSVRQRNAAISRVRKLTKGERDKFLAELDGKPAAELADVSSEEQGGDGDGSGASK